MALSFQTSLLCPVTIGRESLVAATETLLAQIQSGEQGTKVVLLSGEAGIGKSRLVSETKARAEAQGYVVLQGNCFETDRIFPYAPLLDILHLCCATRTANELRHLFAVSDTPTLSVLPTLLALLPELIPLIPESSTPAMLSHLGSEQEKRLLFRVLTDFFVRQTLPPDGTPLLLVIEDVHWCDDVSLEFFQHLIRYIAPYPVACVFTYRPEETFPALDRFLSNLERQRAALEWILPRLTRAQTNAMLRATTQQPLSLGFRNTLYTLTEGNPFFIEELLKSWAATGELDENPDFVAHKVFVPRTVYDTVYPRLAALSEAARSILCMAAVAGRRFNFTLLQTLTGYDEPTLLAFIKESVIAQLVVEEEADLFAFRHALTREAIYATLLTRERQRLHRAIAEVLPDTLEGERAYHFFEAGAWQEALHDAQRAGEEAQRRFATTIAVEQFSRALAAAAHLPDTVSYDLYRARGEAYDTVGDFEAAQRDYEQALVVARTYTNSYNEWDTLLTLGLLWASRDYEQAGVYYESALALARNTDDALMLARSLNRLGNWYLNREDPATALNYHQEALRLYDAHDDKHGRADTLDLLGMADFLSGRLAEAHEWYRTAEQLYQELNKPLGVATTRLNMVAGRVEYQTLTMPLPPITATHDIRWGRVGLEIAHSIMARGVEAYGYSSLAMGLGVRGDYGAALEAGYQSLAIAEEIDHLQWVTMAHVTLGVLLHDMYALEAGREHLEQALAIAHRIHSLHWIRTISGFLASIYSDNNDIEGAARLLDEAMGTETKPVTLGARLCVAARIELALAQEYTDRALILCDAFEDTISPPRIGYLRARALVQRKRFDEAHAILIPLLNELQQYRLRSLEWRVRLLLHTLYHNRGEMVRAEQESVAVHTLLATLASTIPDDALHSQFVTATQRLLTSPSAPVLTPRQRSKQQFDGLTPREREVVALVAQGYSNADIATRLIVTERTVESHISNILSKLGVTTRTHIAIWAKEKGL